MLMRFFRIDDRNVVTLRWELFTGDAPFVMPDCIVAQSGSERRKCRMTSLGRQHVFVADNNLQQ